MMSIEDVKLALEFIGRVIFSSGLIIPAIVSGLVLAVLWRYVERTCTICGGRLHRVEAEWVDELSSRDDKDVFQCSDCEALFHL
jgi:hypothetical protein